MTDAVTITERYRVLARYHRDVFSAIEQGQLQRAMRLLFEFAEDYCLKFESDVASLSDQYQEIINAPQGQTTDPLLFLQAFHKLWIAMEDEALSGFSPDDVQDVAARISDRQPSEGETPTDADSLVDLKKAILRRDSQFRKPLVELKNVFRSFGRSNTFELGPVNLAVSQGQIVGVVGPNGSGKTTLLRVVAADLAQSSGEIDYPGLIPRNFTKSQRAYTSWPMVRSKIAYVPPSPDPIHENTVLALWMTGAAHGISPTELERQITVTMHKYGLNQYADQRVSELSTGYRLRFELARILFTRPALFVLDEPLANLDRNAQLTLLDDLKMLSASVDTPRSIVISSQHIDEIASISDYLVFLSDGDVQFSGRREEVISVLDYSLFEISVTDRLDELEMLLWKCGAVEIDSTPVSLLARFPKGTRQEMLVQAMFEAGLQVKNFRDLSNSIEALLLMPRFKASRQAKEFGTVNKPNFGN